MNLLLFFLLCSSPAIAQSLTSRTVSISTTTPASSSTLSSTRLVTSTMAMVMPSSTNLFPACSGATRQRREIRDLSQTEINAFVNAFVAITKNGGIDNMVSLHTQTTIHFTPYFFPWHRIFMRKFEDLMRTQLGPDWAMPYWDWSIDSQHPEQSVIFTSSFFGQNDQSGGTFSIINSLMQGFQAQIPSPHPLTRSYKGAMGVFTASSVLQAQYIVQSLSFSTFSQNFENLPHAIVHTEIGGDMGVMKSPNDIIFWLHHAFIDKVWWEWQTLGNNINKYDGSAYGSQWSSLTGSSTIPDFNVPVTYALDTSKFCYTYVSPSQATFNQSVDSGLKNITAPVTIPTAWLNQSSSSNTALANKLLNQSQAITNQINQVANQTGGVIPVKRVTDNTPSTPNNAVKGSLGVALLIVVAIPLFF